MWKDILQQSELKSGFTELSLETENKSAPLLLKPLRSKYTSLVRDSRQTGLLKFSSENPAVPLTKLVMPCLFSK